MFRCPEIKLIKKKRCHSFLQVLSKIQSYEHKLSHVSQSSELKSQTHLTLNLILARGLQCCISVMRCGLNMCLSDGIQTAHEWMNAHATHTQTQEHTRIKGWQQRQCVRTKRGFWKLGHTAILGQQFTTRALLWFRSKWRQQKFRAVTELQNTEKGLQQVCWDWNITAGVHVSSLCLSSGGKRL